MRSDGRASNLDVAHPKAGHQSLAEHGKLGWWTRCLPTVVRKTWHGSQEVVVDRHSKKIEQDKGQDYSDQPPRHMLSSLL